MFCVTYLAVYKILLLPLKLEKRSKRNVINFALFS